MLTKTFSVPDVFFAHGAPYRTDYLNEPGEGLAYVLSREHAHERNNALDLDHPYSVVALTSPYVVGNDPFGDGTPASELETVSLDLGARTVTVRRKADAPPKLAVGDLVRPTFTCSVTLGRVVEVLPNGKLYVMWPETGPGSWDADSLIRTKAQDLRRLVAKFPGKCAGCNGRVERSEGVFYSPGSKSVFHVGCA